MRRLVPALLCLSVIAAPANAAQGGREGEALRRELAAQGEASSQRARLAALNAREVEVRRRIERNRGQLARLLGALQMHRRHPPPPLLVNPRSAKDAVRAAILIRAITPQLQARGRAFAEEAEAVSRIRREAAVASEALFRAESEVADRRAEIERLAAARGGEPPASLAPPPSGAAGLPSRFVVPVQGVVGRRFGAPQPGRGRSQGWTWRATPNSPVLSPAAGRVDFAGPLKGWGDVVILRAGGGWRLILAGLERIDVETGQDLAAGEPVGKMGPGAPAPRLGATPTAPEFYLEVRNQADPVDPARWLAARTSG